MLLKVRSYEERIRPNLQDVKGPWEYYGRAKNEHDSSISITLGSTTLAFQNFASHRSHHRQSYKDGTTCMQRQGYSNGPATDRNHAYHPEVTPEVKSNKRKRETGQNVGPPPKSREDSWLGYRERTVDLDNKPDDRIPWWQQEG